MRERTHIGSTVSTAASLPQSMLSSSIPDREDMRTLQGDLLMQGWHQPVSRAEDVHRRRTASLAIPLQAA